MKKKTTLQLQKEIKKLKRENVELKKTNEKLTRQNDALKSEVVDLEKYHYAKGTSSYQ